MAINLASKYSDKIATYFTQQSLMKGMGNNDYSFEGVKSVKIYTPVTVPLGNYTREGANRYGTPVEMQDTVQEMILTQDRAFTLTIDKGNNMEQMNIKGAMRMLRLEIDEQVTPVYDKYVIGQLVKNAGLSGVAGATVSKTNIVNMIADASVAQDNKLVPATGRVLLIPSTNYNHLRLSSEFINNDNLGKTSLIRGQVGEFMNMRVVKIPDTYFPTGVNFMIVLNKSFTAPWRLNDTKVHKDPPGLSGDLLEGRFMWDTFVIGAKADGIYVNGASGSKQADPTIAISSHNATVTSSGATKILYTLDGSDPRYSDSAQVYTAAVAMTAGETIKAVAYADGKLTSDVVEKKDA